MATVLLCVWNMPEELKFYTLDDLTEDEVKVIKRVHEQFLNGIKLPPKVEKSVASVLAAVDKHKQNWDGANLYEGWVDKRWDEKLIATKTPPLLLKNCRLVITGCIL